MTVHDRAAKTYKTLNDAGRSHDECLRAAVDSAHGVLVRERDVLRGLLKRITPALTRIIKHERHGDGDGGKSTYPRELKLVKTIRAALSDGGQKND